MLIAMGLAAVLCIFNGSYPWLLYSLLPYPVHYEPYSVAHVITQSQLLFFSALAFCWLKLTGLYPPELPSVNIDVEWSYRKALPSAARWGLGLGRSLGGGLLTQLQRAIEHLLRQVYRHHGPRGVFGRTWPTGSMAFWMTFLLGTYLIVYYIQ